MRTIRLICISSLLLSGCGLAPETTQNEQNQTTPEPTQTPVETGSRQAWIISPADGVSRTHCLSLPAETSNALETLQATEEPLEVLTDPIYGSAVCRIGNVGWPVTSCFGQTASDPSWLYFTWNSDTNSWESATTAVSNLNVQNGDLLAFVFTEYDSSFNPLREPPLIGFDEICTNE